MTYVTFSISIDVMWIDDFFSVFLAPNDVFCEEIFSDRMCYSIWSCLLGRSAIGAQFSVFSSLVDGWMMLKNKILRFHHNTAWPGRYLHTTRSHLSSMGFAHCPKNIIWISAEKLGLSRLVWMLQHGSVHIAFVYIYYIWGIFRITQLYGVRTLSQK